MADTRHSRLPSGLHCAPASPPDSVPTCARATGATCGHLDFSWLAKSHCPSQHWANKAQKGYTCEHFN